MTAAGCAMIKTAKAIASITHLLFPRRLKPRRATHLLRGLGDEAENSRPRFLFFYAGNDEVHQGRVAKERGRPG